MTKQCNKKLELEESVFFLGKLLILIRRGGEKYNIETIIISLSKSIFNDQIKFNLGPI